MLSVDELNRLESLGDNCELGFIMRRHNHEESGYFKWALGGVPAVVAVLSMDFEGVYLFENIAPIFSGMVEDTVTQHKYHSKMASQTVEGKQVFIDSEEVRRKIHADEIEKIQHLATKFRERVKDPATLFVIKRSENMSADDARSVRAALCKLAGRDDVNLLFVLAEDRPEGTVDEIEPHLFQGSVTRFAPYVNANDIDMDSWIAVLRTALVMTAQPADTQLAVATG